jgi:hypothetical protein
MLHKYCVIVIFTESQLNNNKLERIKLIPLLPSQAITIQAPDGFKRKGIPVKINTIAS